MTRFDFRLVFTHKHAELGPKGEVLRRSYGPAEWKIADAPKMRFATFQAAVAYAKIRDASKDPRIRKNADRTPAILKRQGLPCGPCAC